MHTDFAILKGRQRVKRTLPRTKSAMILFARLNDLSGKLSKKGNDFFSKEFFSEPAKSTDVLIQQYNDQETNSQRKERAYRIFKESLELINGDCKNSESLNLEAIGKVLTFLCNDQRVNLEIFVSLINSFPWEADNGLNDLLGCLKELQSELVIYLNDQIISKGTEKWSRDFWSSFKKSIVPEFFLLQKPNVFLECSTGFSQLMIMLNIAFEDVDRFESIQYYSKQLAFIMGKYKLDPIKSLDLLLQVCSLHIVNHHEFIVELLRSTEYWPTRKEANCTDYQELNQGGNAVATRLIINQLNSGITDIRYIELVVHLIKHGFVSFAAIFDCLSPDYQTINKFVEDQLLQYETESLTGSMNPLAMASALPDEENSEKPAKDEVNNETDLESSVTSEQQEKALREDVLSSNKWKLVEKLLSHGVFSPGLYALNKYPKFFSVNDKLVSCLLQTFDCMIKPLLSNINPVKLSDAKLPIQKLSHNGIPTSQDRLIRQYKSLQKKSQFIQGTELVFYDSSWQSNLTLITDLRELFRYSHILFENLGPRLVLDTPLVEHICLIAQHDISIKPENAILDGWIDYFRKFMIPVLGAVEDEQLISNAIFAVMQKFPFEKRYYLYNEIITKISEENVHVRLNFNRYQKKIKSLLKSLSIDNISLKCRDVANFVSCNPLATLNSIVNQIENYDKVSELIVISAEFFSDFGYDALEYVLLTKLSSGRPTLQDDGITQKMWINRLSLFIAGLAKSCPRMNMSNIFVFMVKNLYKDPSLTLAILKELVTQVAGIQTLYDVNWNTLLMINSGPILKELGRNLILDSREKYHSRSKSIVANLVDLNVVSEMIIMLTNLNLKTQSDELHFKILSTKCDESNSLLWSFIEMLKHALTEEQFEKNILPFNILIEDYQLPIEWTFDIWRDFFDAKLQRSGADASEIKTLLYKTHFNGVNFGIIEKSLFIDFWRLSLYDIKLEESLYNEQKTIFADKKKQSKILKDSSAALSKLQSIEKDYNTHKLIFENTQQIIAQNKAKWFIDMSAERILAFFEYCIIPRVIFSPFDAIYSSSFIIETFGTTDTKLLIEHFIKSNVLGTLLFSSTVNEAGNLALFFKGILAKLEKWRKESAYSNDERRSLHELYSHLVRQISFVLQESNYMSIRNTIQFLNFISELFPVVDEHLENIIDSLDALLETEDREDIKLPTNALKGHLMARLKVSYKTQDFFTLSENEEVKMKEYNCQLAVINKYHEAKRADALAKRKEEDAEEKAIRKSEDSGIAQSRYSDRSSSTSASAPASTLTSTLNSNSIPPYQIVDSLYKIERLIKKGEYNRIPMLLYDKEAQASFKSLISAQKEVVVFRSDLKTFFKNYFAKVVKNLPKQYESTFDIFMSNCNSASLPQIKVSGSMYEDSVTSNRSSKQGNIERNTYQKKDSPSIPKEPKKQSASRYQKVGVVNSLPKAPASLSKTGSDMKARIVTNNNRIQSTLPSGPKGDIPKNNGSHNSLSRSNSNVRKFGSTPPESRKRSSDDSKTQNTNSRESSSRYSNAKRPKKNNSTSEHHSLPTGPKKQSSGSRYSK